MKKFLFFLLLLLILAFCSFYHTEIIQYLMKNYIYQYKTVLQNKSQYNKNSNFLYIKQTDQFEPHNKQDILNIFYSALNNGWEEFNFFCPTDYKECANDVKEITNTDETLSVVNNYVHPYNSYQKLYVTVSSFGRVNVQVKKLYTQMEIDAINLKLETIKKEIIKENMTDKDKIKVFHDYVINHSKYDQERANALKNKTEETPLYLSQKAYGPLIQGMGICSGYSDAMAIFLNQLGIPNYKIANSEHVWNYVYLDNKWYHLDLTWDDPVVDNGKDYLIYDFFLVTTEELEKKDQSQHQYNKNWYLET